MVTCLVTGNLEPIGWGKMQALGLYDLFTGARGAQSACTPYTDAHPQRRCLVGLAATTAQATRRSRGGTGQSLCALRRKRRVRLAMK